MNRRELHERTMAEYFDALLDESAPLTLDALVRQPLEQLLQRVEADLDSTIVNPKLADPVVAEVAATDTATESTVAMGEQALPKEPFQVLYCTVAGLSLALPLVELGGIYRIDTINQIPGRPPWFMGLMPHRDESTIYAVDTACWVMPEKYSEQMAESVRYQYLIMLKDSQWGIACETLVTANSLAPEGVRWRQNGGKRPWLAGMVIDEMCALLNVDAMIAMLEKGLDSQSGEQE